MSKVNSSQIKGVQTGAGGGSIGSGISVSNNGVTLGLFNGLNVHGSATVSATGTIADIYIVGGGLQGSPGVTGPQGPTGPAGGPQGIQGSPGVTGPTGPQGPQGLQGSPGVTGPTGPQGFQGPQGSPGVAGPTGPQGSQGSQGSPGVTGPTGPQGNQGSQGSPGVTGPTGPQGPQGSQGSPGVTGPTGPQGSQGLQGSPGVTGPTGPQGNQGLQGSPGVTGPTGPQGPQGLQGSPGVTGPAGTNGAGMSGIFVLNAGATLGLFGSINVHGPGVTASATGIVADVYITGGGSQGSPGVTGPTGPQGPQGSQGSPGVTGPTGPQGNQGPQGSPGVTGPTGPQGPQGSQGSPGVTGPTGPQGSQGSQGSPGVTGPTGPQGPQGPTGSQGPTGQAGRDSFNSTATFIQNNSSLVSVVSGAYQGWEQLGQAVYVGTAGYYTVTGISGSNLVLANLASNLPSGTVINSSNISPAGIPGITGPTGPQGPQGSQGSPGVTGPTGPQGPQGSQGSPGVTGPTGPQGPTGSQGPQGSPGATGPAGTNGAGASGVFVLNAGVTLGLFGSINVHGPGVTASATGIVADVYITGGGSQGSPGVTGPTGPQGPQGSQGSPGVTGPTGPQGNQGPQGSPGVTGPTGPQGPQGSQGSPGVTGPTGPQGPQGSQGSPGVTGPTGPQGPQGPTGSQGPQGSPGVTGPQGPPGSGGGAGVTLASQSTPGIIYLPAGDLSGTGSNASGPTISKITGDSSGRVGIATGIWFYINGDGNTLQLAAPLSSATGITSTLNGKLAINVNGIPTSTRYPQDVLAVVASAMDFQQIFIQNSSNATTASSDIVATNDIGTNNSYYVDLGINSSKYGISGGVGGPNDSYLYSSNNRVLIGTIESTPTGVISFFTQSGVAEQVRIFNDGGVAVGGSFIFSPGSDNLFVQNAIGIGATGSSGIMWQTVQSGTNNFTLQWPGALPAASGYALLSDGVGRLYWAQGGVGATGPTGPQGPQGPPGGGGGGGGVTLASQSTPGVIYLPAGDLSGTGSNATGPTISRLSGDPSGNIQVPSNVSFAIAVSNGASTAPTGLFRFPRAGQVQAPIMGAIGVSGPYVFMQYGIDPLTNLDEVKFGTSDALVGNDKVSLNAQSKVSFRINGISQISEPVRVAAEIGRDPTTQGPYLGIYGPSGATGMMAFRVQSGVASYTLQWPRSLAAASGYALSSDATGILSWVPNTAPLATSTLPGLVYIPAGDLQGTGSSATGPTISKLSGDASGAIRVPSSAFLYFGGAVQSAAPTGLIRLPASSNNMVPIIQKTPVGALGQNILSYGMDAVTTLDTVNIGDGSYSQIKLLSSQVIYFFINGYGNVAQISGPGTPALGMLAPYIYFDGTIIPGGPVIRVTADNGDFAAVDFQIGAQPPYSSATVNKSSGNLNLAVAMPIKDGKYGGINFIAGASGGYTLIGQFGRVAQTGIPYLGLAGPATATGMMTFQVASGVASYALIWPRALGASGNQLSTDGSGNLSWSAGIAGPTGPTGPQGPAGANGVSTIWLQNNGATLAPVNTVNLLGGLVGTTGAVPGIVNINSLNDFAILGFTGSNLATGNNASGAMVRWTSEIITPTGGAIGHTTIGTAAAWVTVQKAGWYEIDYSIGFTGVSVPLLLVQCFLGATGGNGRFGFGSGSPITQSVSYGIGGSGFASQSFLAYIPSGSSIETYVSPFSPAVYGLSGICFSPTGSKFSIRTRG